MWLEPHQDADAVQKAVGAGLSCWTHAIGDAASSWALEAYEQAGRPTRRRHRIEHLEVLDNSDIPRFGRLDVVASMQPTHMDWSQPDHSDNWSTRLGPDRRNRPWRHRDLLASGATVAFGSDWPITDFDRRVVMAGAQLRRPVNEPGRAPYLADQAVSGLQALAAFTLGPAMAAAEETWRDASPRGVAQRPVPDAAGTGRPTMPIRSCYSADAERMRPCQTARSPSRNEVPRLSKSETSLLFHAKPRAGPVCR